MLTKRFDPRPAILPWTVVILLVLSGCLSTTGSHDAETGEGRVGVDSSGPSGSGGDAGERSSAGAQGDSQSSNQDRVVDDTDASEQLPIRVSHGSAVIELDVNFTLHPPNEQGQANFTPENGSVFVGFLRPETTYRIDTGNQSYTFKTLLSPWSWSPDPLIQPGVRYEIDRTTIFGEGRGYCTMGFILRDATNETLYAMVPRHCVEESEFIYIDDEPVGTVVAMGSPPGNDWGLVELDGSVRDQVSPSIPYWSGPRPPLQDAPVGDTLCFYGQAGNYYPFGSYHPLKDGSPRCGQLLDLIVIGERTFDASGPSGAGGDSGSPVIHHATGAAFGMVTTSTYKTAFGGPKVCHVLASAKELGYDLVIATAPYKKITPGVVPHSVGDGSGTEGCPE